ncbi:MAG TPA: hypothetical protein VHQ65_00905, partial [Thermoanaerobaculia bacterium]|nr:hypothetical protein [Thermoanaerobaculia bacterium]
PPPAPTPASAPAPAPGPAPDASPTPRAKGADLPEPLFFALVLLERDLARGDHGHSTQRILREIAKLLREGDLETLRFTYRTLLGRLQDPRPDLRRAGELIDHHFAG